MADEQSRPPCNRVSPIPKDFGWDVLVELDGDDLESTDATLTHRSLRSTASSPRRCAARP